MKIIVGLATAACLGLLIWCLCVAKSDPLTPEDARAALLDVLGDGIFDLKRAPIVWTSETTISIDHLEVDLENKTWRTPGVGNYCVQEWSGKLDRSILGKWRVSEHYWKISCSSTPAQKPADQLLVAR